MGSHKLHIYNISDTLHSRAVALWFQPQTFSVVIVKVLPNSYIFLMHTTADSSFFNQFTTIANEFVLYENEDNWGHPAT